MKASAALVPLLLAAALGTSTHAAAEKLRLGVFGSGKGAGPLLTKAELRECLALNERVRASSEAALREREQIDKDMAGLLRERQDIEAAIPTLDKTSAEAIGQHNARVRAHEQAVQAFTARSEAFNAQVGALEADRASFQQRCDNRRFDQLDEEAIRKGR